MDYLIALRLELELRMEDFVAIWNETQIMD